MTSKYLACLLAGRVVIGCTTPSPALPQAPTPTAAPSAAAAPAATPSPPTPPPVGLERPIAAVVNAKRRWYLVPDGLPGGDGPSPTAAVVGAQCSGDPTAGTPFARVRATGREYPLVLGAPGGPLQATIPLDGLAPDRHQVDVVLRLTGGREAVVGTAEFILSAPEYVVWTLDFEGDESEDPEMANAGQIGDSLKVPMVVMWNPRVWNTAEVRPTRAEAMLAWTKERATKGDEIALHLHG